MNLLELFAIYSLVLMELYTFLLDLHWSKALHYAKLNTYGCFAHSCQANCKGIHLKVVGIHQRAHLVAIEFTKTLKTLADRITEEQFRVCVEKTKKDYENELIKPSLLKRDLHSSILDASHISLFDKKNVLKTLELKDFQEFHRKFLRKVQVANVTNDCEIRQGTNKIMNEIQNVLGCGKTEYVSNFNKISKKLCLFKIYNDIFPGFSTELKPQRQ